MGDDNPVNPVTRVEPNRSSPSAAILVVEDCVVCGDRHTHGLPNYEERLEVGYTAERGAHCDNASSYQIQITEDTEIDV